MNRLNKIIILLLSSILMQTLCAQSYDALFVSDTLSNLERAEMLFSMAEEEDFYIDRRKLFRMSSDLYQKAYEAAEVPTFQDSVEVLFRRSVCHVELQDIDNNTDLLQKAIDLNAYRFGLNSEEYANALIRASSVCCMAQDYVQAAELLRICKDLPCDRAYYQMARSMLESGEGCYGSAYRFSRKAYRIMKKDRIGGQLYLANLQELSKLALLMNRRNALRRYHQESIRLQTEDMLSKFDDMSEIRRNVYWEKASDYFDGILNLASNTMYRSVRGDAYDALLFSKGLMLNASISFRRYVKEAGSAEAQRLLAVMDSLEIAAADATQIDSVDQAIVRVLRSEGRSYTSMVKEVTWKDVRDALQPDDLAIEFYRLNDGSYGALLLKRNWKYPKQVSLGSTYALSRREKYSLEDGRDANQLSYDSLWINDCARSKAIWKRHIRRHFPVTEEGRIFFSPDGAFHKQGIEYLPYYIGTSGAGSAIIDDYQIYRLSSTRSLVDKSDDTGHGHVAGLYGGAMFNSNVDEIRYAIGEMHRTDKSLIDEYYEQELRHMESSETSRSVRDRMIISPLPATAREVHEVDDILSDHGVTSQLYTGIFANEETFKEKSVGKQIVHIATHGFYVTTYDALSNNAYYRTRYYGKSSALSDPLYRTGLHLAGAASSWAGYPDIPGLEDGVLTAKEVSLMDLSDADLVVLSACQTGAGEVSKDGVYGLQRAFKKAGARSVIMTLWEVDDNATYLIIKEFYKNRYVDGMSKHEAFDKALALLRSEYPDPYYWRAFLLLDPEIR